MKLDNIPCFCPVVSDELPGVSCRGPMELGLENIKPGEHALLSTVQINL
ncbi:dynein heavy chain 8 [Corchorus olitorius]|uniref:Dynein heavy chain 8 n=1 Tax=Corchorus olitorius TaxID=93759 RepID=A0A1R3GAR3_9ROSI|nr:dynein heavy chain 8 [Corchorus olitorius]